MIGFEFKIPYKLQVSAQQKTIGIVRIDLLSSHTPMDWEFFEAFNLNLPKTLWALLESVMSAPREIINTEQVV